MLKFSIAFLFLYYLLQNTQRCSSLPNPNAFQAGAAQRQLNTNNGVAAKGPVQDNAIFLGVKKQLNGVVQTIMDLYAGIKIRMKSGGFNTARAFGNPGLG